MSRRIIGLSPMDGITDAPFRFIVDKYGHPDLLFTEFVSANGLALGRLPVFDGLIRYKTETPTIAQLIGSEPEKFYTASIIVLSLGFNGIDINMGCPDRSVNKKGGGAALINQPALAKKIIRKVQQAVTDWTNGQRLTKAKISVSIKTRLGFHSVELDWFKSLLETGLDMISIHGRTFDQLFHGHADWESIGRIVELAKKSKTKILGNGDIKNKKEALEKINQFKVNGVLIGRACRGNPWVFTDYEPTTEDRKKVMIEHCQKFLELLPDHNFNSLRKHLAWYCKDFPGSAEVKNQLMAVKNIEDVFRITSLLHSPTFL